MIWLLNGANGQYISCFSGHKDSVNDAQFSKHDGGKLIVSCSSDKTVKVWSPKKTDCLVTIEGKASTWHSCRVNCLALCDTQPLVISGDISGRIFSSNYMTG